MRFRLVSFALSIWFLAVVYQPAFAHADPVRTVPQSNAVLDRSPDKVEIFFNEEIDPAFSKIRVLDSQGARVDNGDTHLDSVDPTHLRVSLPVLPDGVYTVAWQALSADDGHVTSGAFPFIVGNAQSAAALSGGDQADNPWPASPWDVAARWMLYLAVAVLVGGTFFTLFAWRPVVAAAAGQTGALARYESISLRLAAVALLALGLAGFLSVLARAGQLGGSGVPAPWSQAALSLLLTTRSGVLALAWLGLGTVLADLLLPAQNRWNRWAGFGAGLLLLFSISLGSHAAAESRPFLPVLVDWFHLLAASLWVGGLFQFFAALWALRLLEPAARTRVISRLVPRFSAIGLFGVGGLALSGVYSATLRIGDLNALVGTFYGRILILKTLIALPMVALGAYNFLKASPALRKEADQSSPGASLVARFHRRVSREAALGIVLLLCVGLLTSLPPARSALANASIRRSARADDLRLRLEVAPGRVGVNTFTVRATQGSHPLPDALVKDVELRFTPLTADVPPSAIALWDQGSGVYSGQGAYLSMPDRWQVQVVVRREGHFDAFANFTLSLGQVSAFSFPLSWAAAGLLVLAALAYAWGYRALVRRRRAFLFPALLPPLGIFLILALVFARPSALKTPGPANQVSPGAESGKAAIHR